AELFDVELGALDLADDLGLDLRAGDVRRADLAAGPLAEHQDAVEADGGLAGGQVAAFEKQGIALANHVLLAPVFNDGVHAGSLRPISSRESIGDGAGFGKAVGLVASCLPALPFGPGGGELRFDVCLSGPARGGTWA